MTNFKRAAMFGLDARIALAIFGALSVISGASLYGAIQEAKATKIFTEMREVAKAWDSYFLDTGSYLPRMSPSTSSSDYRLMNVPQLIENSLSKHNWRGPYVTLTKRTSTVSINCPSGMSSQCTLSIFELRDNPGVSATNTCYNKNDNCAIWVGMYRPLWEGGVLNTAIANKIDQKFDSGDGAVSGNFQWSTTYYFYKVVPINGLKF